MYHGVNRAIFQLTDRIDSDNTSHISLKIRNSLRIFSKSQTKVEVDARGNVREMGRSFGVVAQGEWEIVPEMSGSAAKQAIQVPGSEGSGHSGRMRGFLTFSYLPQCCFTAQARNRFSRKSHNSVRKFSAWHGDFWRSSLLQKFSPLTPSIALSWSPCDRSSHEKSWTV